MDQTPGTANAIKPGQAILSILQKLIPMQKPQGIMALVLLLASHGAEAFRCDGYLIDAGQSQFEVRGKCGDPQGSERRTVWRLLTTFQEQCQTVMQPAPPGPASANPNRSPLVAVPRTVCTTIPINYTVPVDEEIWYFEDSTVPKALHFENGRLVWVETLWRLRQQP